MFIYHYDKNTKEFLESTVADKDPEATRIKGEFVPLIPACATLVKPPITAENEIAVFNGEDWTVMPDFRKNFKKCDDNFNISDITEIGVIVDGYLVTNDRAENIKLYPEMYKICNGEIIQKTSEEIKEERILKEKKIIARLSMTPLDFINAIETLGVSYSTIKELCNSNEEIEKQLKFCSRVYRFNPLLNELCGQFNITPEQLDDLFKEYGNYGIQY